MKKEKVFGYFFLMLFITACGISSQQRDGQSIENSLFTLLPSEETGITFVNQVENQRNFNIFKYRNFYNGGGVAIGDINNDSLPDIYFTANMNENRLYLNKGNFRFEDISESAGVTGNKPWSTGVVMVDINGDGLLDIYVCNAGNMEGNNHDNDLYINNGDLTFTERATEYNLAKTGFTTHASFFDFDRDGDLDAYILNNSNIPVSSLGNAGDRKKRADQWEDVPEIFRGVGDLLMRNDGGKFVDVSEEAGIYGSLIGFGLGVYVCDLNEDHFPDIYISNDFFERDYLYINQQDGTFSEEIKEWTSHLCLSAMGVDMGDVNNDGLNDIFITDMMPEEDQRTKSVMEFEGYNIFKLKQNRDFYQQYIQNTLQINNGNRSFTEIAYFSGVAKTDWSWAGLIFDMDNDGYKDIYVTNGIIHDLTDIDFVDFFANEIIQNTVLTGEKEEVLNIIKKMPVVPLSNYSFHNKGDLTFENTSVTWGMDTPGFSNGCAYGDLDNDGDLDLVVNNVNMEAFIYRNESRQKRVDNNYLQLSFKGKDQNLFAIGAVVKMYADDQIILQENMPSRGFQSSVDYVMNVGLGKIQTLDSIHVFWPDGKFNRFENIKANQHLLFDQKDAVALPPTSQTSVMQLFSKADNSTFNPHIEDPFNDFDQERMIDRHLSKEGPALAVGDVNGDGNEDVFIGGAKRFPAHLYIQQDLGKFTEKANKWFDIDAGFEDTAASFFDADGDGDVDLVVGTGGNSTIDQNFYMARLYLNDGNGNFTRPENNLPTVKTNISVIAPFDFDEDGDIDLFVGSRSVPGVYGIDPEHLFLINDGRGNFSDGTERYAYDLKKAGMVTDAIWADMDGDGRADLVTVSEWGVPMVMKNSGKRLAKWDTELDSLKGWWKAVEAKDLDKDGDLDLILGNKGTNIPYPASKENPVKLFMNDFDNNGAIDQITTIHYNDGDYPIHMRKELTEQFPHLRNEKLKASDYAKMTIEQLFTSKVMENTVHKEVTISETIIAVNEGNGIFRVATLPQRVQWSVVNTIMCEDINTDGNMDIIMAGNFYEYKPQYSRQDASYGHVLLGDGNMNFEWVDYKESGFFIRGEVRHGEFLSFKKHDNFIILVSNNEQPKLFKTK